MEISNNVLAVLVIVAVAVSISGTMTMLSLVSGPAPITGFTQQQQGTATATLLGEAGIELLITSVDFGKVVALESNDTTNFHPHPFVLENNGSTSVNISIAEESDNTLWGLDNSYENCFRYNSTKNVSGTVALAYQAWTNFDGTAEAADIGSVSTDPANLVWNLSQASGEKRLTVHLNISVPPDEEAGPKSTNIFFKAAVG